MTGARRAGVVFVVLFVAAFVVSFGTLVGSFADSDRVFTERFAEDGDRIRDIAGSYLMAFAGLAFVWFAHSMAHAAPSRRAALLVTGSATGGAMVVAAVAAATVPMSRWFGDLVDDPGLREGQAVLPHLAYVALGMGAMVPAAAFIVVASRAPGLLPRWLSAVGYPAAVLVAFTALLFMPLFVFVAWVVAAAVCHQGSSTA